MAVTDETRARLTLGPVLFHWDAARRLDFYNRMAAAPVDEVVLGEVICSKRAPFFEGHIAEVADMLSGAGKQVILATLAEVMLKRERDMVAALCAEDGLEPEVNDSTALWHLDGRPFRIGPFLNVYNEDTLAFLADRGAVHVCLPPELPRDSVAVMARRARALGMGVEVLVFGRLPLALSARCYHARAHGRIKDNCQFVCETDPDGMPLTTLAGQEFLAVNGIQTLSYRYLNLIGALAEMQEMGVTHFRLSPHTLDMAAVAGLFRAVLDGRLPPAEATDELAALGAPAPFVNGFWHGRPGRDWVADGVAAQPA